MVSFRLIDRLSKVNLYSVVILHPSSHRPALILRCGFAAPRIQLSHTIKNDDLGYTEEAKWFSSVYAFYWQHFHRLLHPPPPFFSVYPSDCHAFVSTVNPSILLVHT